MIGGAHPEGILKQPTSMSQVVCPQVFQPLDEPQEPMTIQKQTEDRKQPPAAAAEPDAEVSEKNTGKE
jgi:hypothetical protein